MLLKYVVVNRLRSWKKNRETFMRFTVANKLLVVKLPPLIVHYLFYYCLFIFHSILSERIPLSFYTTSPLLRQISLINVL